MRTICPWLFRLSSLPRLVRRHCGYFAFATTTAAVAVGVNLVVFTVVNALWLRPLPFPDADRLVTVMPPFIGFTTLDGAFLTNTRPHPFDALAGQVLSDDERGEGNPVPRLAINGQAVETIGVTPEYFLVLGVPVRGRGFATADDREGAEPVAIISDRLWSRAFDRRTDIIGAVVAAQPLAVRIIGIAPKDFDGARRGERTDVWIPSTLVPRTVGASTNDVTLMLFARLAPGVSPAEAERSLLLKDQRWKGLAILRLKDIFGTPTSRTIPIREGNAVGVVAGLACLVLAGGCATLAALVLVHYERRRRELAVRLAMGASRGRLVGELARELLLVAVAGTIGAVLVAMWSLRSIPSLSLPGGVNLGRLDLSIDWRVLGVAVAATVLTLMAAASLPIVRFTRARLAGDLLAGPSATASAASQRIRQMLLALHVAATIVVLIAAGLFVRAVNHGFGRGAGFDFERIAFVTVDVSAPSDFASIKKPSDWNTFDQDGLTRIRGERKARVRDALVSVPGVSDVAEGSSPIGLEPATFLLKPTSVEADGVRREVLLGRITGSAELAKALGVPLVAGRALTASDAGVSPAPALMTASLGQTLWPGGNPLGQVFSSPGMRFGRNQVVGVTRDFVYGSFARPATGVVMTVSNSPRGARAQYIVRAANPGALADNVRRAASEAMPGTRWVKVATGREVIDADLGRQRLGAWFFSGFGLTALLLGIGGVFGLVAYLAESRQREFGVRLALGATPRDLLRHGVSAALVPVALGAAAGLMLAAWVARLFTSMLAGVSALDPFAYATAAAILLGGTALAALGGAWRLRTMAPMDALRAE